MPTNEFEKRSLSTASNESNMSFYSCDKESFSEERGEVKLNLQRMQRRVVELENVCGEMKGQMSRLVRHTVLSSPTQSRALPKLC